eukprot:scpid85102/ scgid18360/ 
MIHANRAAVLLIAAACASSIVSVSASIPCGPYAKICPPKGFPDETDCCYRNSYWQCCDPRFPAWKIALIAGSGLLGIIGAGGVILCFCCPSCPVYKRREKGKALLSVTPTKSYQSLRTATA